MKTSTIARGSILLVTFALTGALMAAANAQSAPAPVMKVGDRWVYNVVSGIGLQNMSYEETREVTAVEGGGYTVKVTGRTAGGADFSRMEEFSAPGMLRSGTLCLDEMRRYPTPLQRVAFPIAPGQRSAKWVNVVAENGNKGQINYSFQTRSWEKVTVPAGTFDAIRVDVLMILDDATAFRNGTNCNFTYWYSPAVRGPVRERRSAQYTDTDAFMGTHRVLSASYELASFTPGTP
jgi:hypothetical protein